MALGRNVYCERKNKRKYTSQCRIAQKEKVIKWKIRHSQFKKRMRIKPDFFVSVPDKLFLSDDKIAKNFIEKLDYVLRTPNCSLDFSNVTTISLRAGLTLKAFNDQFLFTYKRKPWIKKPKNEKTQAVLQYLKIREYGVKCQKYRDLTCWQLYDFDKESEKNIPLLLTLASRNF